MTRQDDTGAHEVVVVTFDSPPDSEACALRLALTRLQQDVYALQRTLERLTNERNSWRMAYYRALRERAEWITEKGN